MRRRAFLAVPLALAACGGLAERPYAERRQWPLLVHPPDNRPPRRGAPILEVRPLRAGPGLDARGLQSLASDGSMRTAFYEEWAVPPAEGVGDALRQWLANCGKFGGVVAPGSRLTPDLVMEGELTALWSEPAQRRARATLAITVVDQHGVTTRILLQRTFTGTASLASDAAPDAAHAQLDALADAFRQIEQAVP